MDLRSAHKPQTQPPARLRLSLTRTLEPQSPSATDQHYQSSEGGLYDRLAQHKNKQRQAQYACVPSPPQTPTPSQGPSEEDWEGQDEEEEDDDEDYDEEMGAEEDEVEMAIQRDVRSKCASWSDRGTHIITTTDLIPLGCGSAVWQPWHTIAGPAGHTTSKISSLNPALLHSGHHVS